MELLGLATIIAYTLSTFSMKYVLVDEERSSYKKTYFDILFFFSLVLFSAYTYNLVDNLYQRFNFITSRNYFLDRKLSILCIYVLKTH